MINFKIRKIIALVFGVINILISFIFYGVDFGIFISLFIILALWSIWYRKFVARLFNEDPWLVEILGWAILFTMSFYNTILLINK